MTLEQAIIIILVPTCSFLAMVISYIRMGRDAKRDRLQRLLDRERETNARVEAERERLAGEVGDLKQEVKRVTNSVTCYVDLMEWRGKQMQLYLDALVSACDHVPLSPSERQRERGRFLKRDSTYIAALMIKKAEREE